MLDPTQPPTPPSRAALAAEPVGEDLENQLGNEDFTIEWSDSKGYISDVRVTRGIARYRLKPLRRFRYWLANQFPWLPTWVTGWRTVRYRRPTVPFPES